MDLDPYDTIRHDTTRHDNLEHIERHGVGKPVGTIESINSSTYLDHE
jgi:hypothetical protein